MAINTNSKAKAAPSTATTSAMAAGIASNANDLIEMNVIKRADGTTEAATATTTPILKRKGGGGSKRLQFSTPECSVNPIVNAVPRCVSPRLIPSRKREEATVMANLRKRVAACDLERRRPLSGDSLPGEPNLEDLDNRPLISKQSFSNRDSYTDGGGSGTGDESPKSINSSFVQDKDFILDCLCWHNEYRARHSAQALTISPELCDAAQKWANYLAALNEFYYRPAKTLGQNLFCCPCSALVTDLTGQEVASYWYSTVRRYNYFKDIRLLHTNVNAGHFTQMVWRKTKYFGIGKATSKTGKIFVVAYYYPAGNVVNQFHQNVLPPTMDGLPKSGDGGNGSNSQISTKNTSSRRQK